MSIITDLQSLAISGDSNVVSLLKTAYLAARKLGIRDFQEWITHELNGYKDKKDIPTYRITHGTLVGWNPYNGWIPAVITDNKIHDTVTKVWIANSIPSLVALEKETNISYPVSANQTALLSEYFDFETNYTLRISSNTITNIIELVKNKILEWAILLEENGIEGHGLSFTSDEKSKVQHTDQITNYTTNIYGSVFDTQIQQGSRSSKQKK